MSATWPDDLGDPRIAAGVRLPSVVLEHLVEAELHVLMGQVCGESVITIDDGEHPLTVDRAIWIPAGTEHSIATGTESAVLPMFFRCHDHPAARRSPIVIDVDRELRTLFLVFVPSLYTIIQPGVDVAQQILTQLAVRPPAPAAVRTPTMGPAAGIARALRSDPGDNRSVAELARAAHASTRTIERAFRSETGMTLQRWRIENRMEAAAALLRTTPMSVDAIAHRVGYADTSAFRRAFKSSVGATPREYAARFH